MTSQSIRRALAALVLVLATAAGAAAQGSFYREVEKDGRIYVFNNMTQFSDWEKSGEMGVGHHPSRLRARRRDHGLRQRAGHPPLQLQARPARRPAAAARAPPRRPPSAGATA